MNEDIVMTKLTTNHDIRHRYMNEDIITVMTKLTARHQCRLYTTAPYVIQVLSNSVQLKLCKANSQHEIPLMTELLNNFAVNVPCSCT